MAASAERGRGSADKMIVVVEFYLSDIIIIDEPPTPVPSDFGSENQQKIILKLGQDGCQDASPKNNDEKYDFEVILVIDV